MGQKDAAEKILAEYDDVFADIVNGLLFNGEQVVKEDELLDAAVRSQYKADLGRIHEQERDVAKIWKKCGIQIALIGMENQTEADPFMPLRVIGYDGAAYRAQLLGGEKPKQAFPVITLVLYFGNGKWNKPKNLAGCLDVPENLRPFVSDYKINVFEIASLSPEQVAKFKSDFRIVADFFVQQRINNEYKPGADKIRHVDAILKLLEVMSSDRRFGEIDLEQLKAKNDGGVTMCEVLDRVESRGIAIGTERGARQGAEQALALAGWLLEQGRLDDLKRATSDMAYMQGLLAEKIASAGKQP